MTKEVSVVITMARSWHHIGGAHAFMGVDGFDEGQVHHHRVHADGLQMEAPVAASSSTEAILFAAACGGVEEQDLHGHRWHRRHDG
jgi:hypothetical protein